MSAGVEMADAANEAVRLIRDQRWAALATVDGGVPVASMVAYAPEPELGGLLLFLSGLARHTRSLRAEPRACLVVSEPDPGEGDPQLLPRVSIEGEFVEVPRDGNDFEDLWSLYVGRFPEAAPRLALADFALFRLLPTRIRWVGGFAQAVTLDADRLRKAALRSV